MNNSTPILLDGALGTALFRAGMPAGACPEAWILEDAAHTKVVRDLQRAYVRAGSRLLYTPTFGSNSAVLSAHGLAHRAAEFSQKLAALTRGVAEECACGVRVVGDLSPTGRFLAPLGDASFEELFSVYKEQIAAMDPYVDAFVCETNLQLSDARAALFAAREVAPHKDFFATFTLSGDYTTIGGTDIRSAAVILFSLGAKGVGINCSTGPEAMKTPVTALSLYRGRDKVILAKPNAGLPDAQGNFSLSPQAFAASTAELFDCGADYLGGCCGTSPEYLEALARALEKKSAPRAHAAQDTLLATERAVFDARDVAFGEAISASEDLFMQPDLSGAGCHLYFENKEAVQNAAQVFCYLVNTPVCFSAADEETLSYALYLYQGRAAVCGKNLSDKEKEHISTTYSPVFL